MPDGAHTVLRRLHKGRTEGEDRIYHVVTTMTAIDEKVWVVRHIEKV
jgi:hypothetical protein